MTRSELIKAVAKQCEMRQVDIAEVFEAIEDIAYKKAKDEKVRILDGITIESKITGPRMARNPQTGEPVKVPAKRVPKITAGKKLKEAVR